MLELVDEVDSKSIGLIPRAGSTPATGTIFAPKCHASEHFLLLRSKILNIFRKRRKNCICRRDLTGKIQMCVNIGSGADVAVPQPFLNLLQAHTIGIEQTGTTMPLRYNYDKPEKPRISRAFGYLARFFILFQTGKSSREVVISWGGVIVTTKIKYRLGGLSARPRNQDISSEKKKCPFFVPKIRGPIAEFIIRCHYSSPRYSIAYLVRRVKCFTGF